MAFFSGLHLILLDQEIQILRTFKIKTGYNMAYFNIVWKRKFLMTVFLKLTNYIRIIWGDKNIYIYIPEAHLRSAKYILKHARARTTHTHTLTHTVSRLF